VYARRRTDRDWMLQHGSSSLLRSPERSQALAPTNASNIFHGGSRWWQSRGRERAPSTQGLLVMCAAVCVLIYSPRHAPNFHSLLPWSHDDEIHIVLFFFRSYIINAPPSTPSRVFCVWMRLWETWTLHPAARFYMRVDCFRAVGKGEVNFSR
jgi:hypothetical protein